MKAAFYKGTRPGLAGYYNRLVRWWENGKYSHCEMVFSDGLAASSSFADGGVRFKAIEFSPDKWDFIDLPDELEAPARAWFEAHKGQKYDVLGNLRFALDFMNQDDSKWFCSEAFSESVGIADSWRFGPNTLARVLAWRYKPRALEATPTMP